MSIQARIDAMIDFATGMGTASDRLRNVSASPERISPSEARNWYLASGFLQRIIDAKPHDATRAWIDIETSADTEHTKISRMIMNRLEELGLKQKIFSLMQADNLYDTPSFLYPVIKADDPQWAAELNKPLPQRIKKILSVNLITPDHYSFTRISRNPLTALYNKKRIIVSGVSVDESRIIFLEKTYFDEEVSGISLLSNVLDIVKAHGNGLWSVSQLLIELSGKIFQSDEIDSIKDDDKRNFLAKLKTVWSSQNAILIKKNEEFKRLSSVNEMAGFKDIIDFVMLSVALKTGIPRTRLEGQSQGLVRADQDVQGYYESVSADQENKLRPILNRFVDLVIREEEGEIYRELGGRVGDLDYEITFKPLTIPDKVKDAQVDLYSAQIAQIYVQLGALSPDEVRKELRPDLETFAEHRGQEYDLNKSFPTPKFPDEAQKTESSITGDFQGFSGAATGNPSNVN